MPAPQSRRDFLLTLGSTAALAPVLAACTGRTSTPGTRGTLRYGTVTEISSLDPHVYAGSAWKVVIEALYSPLVGFDTNGSVVPRLARHWETPDDLTIVFRLRHGVRFHDGTPLTADDVKFSLDRILDARSGATLRPNLAGITVTVAGDDTVLLRSAEPNATLLSVLALPEASIMSRQWMMAGPNIRVFANGTGPFRLGAYEPMVRVVLERNPEFFIEGKPLLDTVEIRMIRSDDARVAALLTDAVDMIDFVPQKDIDRLIGRPGITVDTQPGAFMNLFFNASKHPFDDHRVRRAFAFAIDRAGVARAAFFGHGSAIQGPPTTTDSFHYSEDLDRTFSYNPTRARELLAEAGLEHGFDFELLVLRGLSTYTSTAQIVQSNLRDIGVNARIQLIEFADLMDRRNRGHYDVMVFGVSVKLPDPDAYSYYLGSESTYWAKPIGYHDAVLDELLAKGRATRGPEARAPIYRAVEERILETSPWVFINWREQAQAYHTRVHGYHHLPGALNEGSAGISLPSMYVDR